MKRQSSCPDPAGTRRSSRGRLWLFTDMNLEGFPKMSFPSVQRHELCHENQLPFTSTSGSTRSVIDVGQATSRSYHISHDLIIGQDR